MDSIKDNHALTIIVSVRKNKIHRITICKHNDKIVINNIWNNNKNIYKIVKGKDKLIDFQIIVFYKEN
jgi:hypothetical protein